MSGYVEGEFALDAYLRALLFKVVGNAGFCIMVKTLLVLPVTVFMWAVTDKEWKEIG